VDLLQVPIGATTIQAALERYGTGTGSVTVAQNQSVTLDLPLKTPRAVPSPAALAFVLPAGQSRTGAVGVGNTGTLDLTVDVRENGGGVVLPGGTPSTGPGSVLRSFDASQLLLPWGCPSPEIGCG
jgi:hypothetical protein